MSWRQMSTPSTRVVCKSTPFAGNTQRCAWISDWHIPSCYTVSEFKTNLLYVWKQTPWNANTNLDNKTYYSYNLNITFIQIIVLFIAIKRDREIIKMYIKIYQTTSLYLKQQLIGLVSVVNMDIVWGKSRSCSSVLEWTFCFIFFLSPFSLYLLHQHNKGHSSYFTCPLLFKTVQISTGGSRAQESTMLVL